MVSQGVFTQGRVQHAKTSAYLAAQCEIVGFGNGALDVFPVMAEQMRLRSHCLNHWMQSGSKQLRLAGCDTNKKHVHASTSCSSASVMCFAVCTTHDMRANYRRGTVLSGIVLRPVCSHTRGTGSQRTDATGPTLSLRLWCLHHFALKWPSVTTTFNPVSHRPIKSTDLSNQHGGSHLTQNKYCFIRLHNISECVYSKSQHTSAHAYLT